MKEVIEAIVLAAGYSSRAKNFKMTMPLGEKPILEHTISKFEGICQRVIVITGYKQERIEKTISKMDITDMKIECVHNEHFIRGMFSSIQKGCEYLRSSTFFMTPGDYPLVSKNTIQSLANEKGEVVIPSNQYKAGHPIKLSKDVKEAILCADSNSNLRCVLRAFEKNYMNVDDPGILIDLDTPEDYRGIEEYYHNYFSI